MIKNSSGQTTLEFAIISPLFAFILFEIFSILQGSFQRTECTRLVFEAVHGARSSRLPALYKNRVLVLRVKDGVEGKLKCGTHTETLFLPDLGSRSEGVSPSL